MENYYLKYAADLPFPFPSIKKIKEEYLQIWKQNIIKEIFAFISWGIFFIFRRKY
jgi:hypothetical protein